MKTFWKQFTLLDAIKDICDWWVEVKISTLTGVWKQLTSTLIGWSLWGPHTLYSYFSEEVTANVLEIARELKVEPKEMTKLLQSHDRLWTCKELVLVNEQKKKFLEIESILMKALWRMLKAIKKNTFESVLMRWMKLEPIIQTEVSQKEKHQYSILTHIYGI